jgi:predicted metal-binding protein
MEKVTPRWSERIVFICSFDRACSGKSSGGISKSSCGPKGADELRGWLKERLKSEGLWKRVRVTTASCLDVCSEKGVTVTIQGRSGEGDVRIVDASEEREDLYRAIIQGMKDE